MSVCALVVCSAIVFSRGLGVGAVALTNAGSDSYELSAVAAAALQVPTSCPSLGQASGDTARRPFGFLAHEMALHTLQPPA